jgi:hypothetical protein
MTTKGEWVAYTGSDEQIASMWENSYLLLDKSQVEMACKRGASDWAYRSEFIRYCRITYSNISKILICNPHPLADMICQWARTGQPVWVRYEMQWDRKDNTIEIDETTTPNWNIPNAEYSFAPFKDTSK